jgi:hypothetical protein
MRRHNRQEKHNQTPLGIRNRVWLFVLGVALLGIIAVRLSRKGTIENPTEQSFEFASAAQHSPFAQLKHPVEPAAFSHSNPGYADEIDVIDFSIINDRRHWVDGAWSPH